LFPWKSFFGVFFGGWGHKTKSLETYPYAMVLEFFWWESIERRVFGGEGTSIKAHENMV